MISYIILVSNGNGNLFLHIIQRLSLDYFLSCKMQNPLCINKMQKAEEDVDALYSNSFSTVDSIMIPSSVWADWYGGFPVLFLIPEQCCGLISLGSSKHSTPVKKQPKQPLSHHRESGAMKQQTEVEHVALRRLLCHHSWSTVSQADSRFGDSDIYTREPSVKKKMRLSESSQRTGDVPVLLCTGQRERGEGDPYTRFWVQVNRC